MNKIGNYIKQLRLSRGMTQEELGEVLGVKKAAVQKWESGQTQNLKRATIKQLADFFGVSPASFIIDDDTYTDLSKYGIMPIETQRIPLLGEIACGEPIFCDEDRESYVEVGTEIKADFCLRAKGDSMINARIYDGDIVFIRQQSMVANGEIAAVVIDDSATLKRVYFYPEKSKLVLNPENPAYEPLVYIGDELNEVRILGKAVAFQSDL